MPKDFVNRPFNRLKKQLAARPAGPPPLPPVERLVTDDELFENAMTDVQVIEAFRILPCAKGPKRPAPPRAESDPDAEAVGILEQIAAGAVPINLSDTQEYIEWANPDQRPDLAGELHAGRYSVEGFLDLHGATAREVNDELDSFLSEAFRRGWRCVKLIHGRGLRSVRGPVLKDAVVRRLIGKYRKQVVAFVSARQCDGGLGALYVLLGNG